MEWALILQAVIAALKFPKEVRDLYLLLSLSDSERRTQISQKIASQLESVKSGGKPSWD